MQIDEFFATYYQPIRLLGRSPRTTELYQASIRNLSKYLGRPAELTDLRDEIIGRYIQHLVEIGRRPAGCNKELAQLTAIWRLAARKRMVEEWPEIRRLPEPEVLPVAWTMEELWRLRISCNYVPGDYNGVPANRWWLALHAVLWSTGERITAAMRLLWGDICGDVIQFRAENRKGGTNPNAVTVPVYVVESLELIRQPDRCEIFRWPYTETYLYRTYHGILERAELDTSARSKFHRIRRSHATHLKLAGGDPTSSLKHSDPATTLRYIDYRQLPRPAELLPEFGTG
jgi:integrase